MLKVDLGLLARERRVPIDADLAPDDPLWQGIEARLEHPVRVRLDAQQAGEDVVVRGRVAGTAELPCRRCLRPVRVAFEEPVTAVYRADVAPAEAETEEAYALPARARELDVGPAVREHLLLAAPEYALCAETCRGLCPQCGANLNETGCGCEVREVDERWSALRRLRPD